MLCACFLFLSCFAVSSSAESFNTASVLSEDNDIVISFSSDGGSIWYPKSSSGGANVAQSYFDYNHNDGYIILMPDEDFYNKRMEEGIASHGWSSFSFNVSPSVDLSTIDLDSYDLQIDWNLNNNYSDMGEGLTTNDIRNLTPNLGLLNQTLLDYYGGGVPSVNGICGYDLSPYYDTYVTFSGDILSSSYLFTDTITITDILDGSFKMSLPFSNINSDVLITLNMKLIYTGTDDNVVNGDPGGLSPDDYVSSVDFTTPTQYDYDILFYPNRPSYGVLSNYSITDFYTYVGTRKMRDYTDKFIISSQPIMQEKYKTLLTIGYSDSITYDDYFTDSLFEMYKIELPYGVAPINYTFDTLDMSLAGFRMEIYFSFPSGFVYDSYKSFIDSANSYYVGFEPFSLKLGNTTIPYDYFTFSHSSDGKQFRATLELDGKNDAHRNFMNLISRYYADDLTLTFSLPVDTENSGVMVGFTNGGFWHKYEAPPIDVPPEEPPSTDDDGFTQEDIDNAYDSGYNHGYNQGTSDGSDKNYVFGFVNGMFSSVVSFYNTLANGISIGGITLGSIVTSIIIIVVLSILIKKVL